MAGGQADPEVAGRIPTDLNALMQIQNDTYDNTEGRESDNRHVRVTEVRQPDGSSAYIVTVPGTNGLFDFPGSVTGGDEAFDNTSNLELQAGQRSASMEAVEAAMEEAGVAPSDAVMIGDTSFDMDMAGAAGIAAFGVAWGYHPVERLQASGAAHVAGDFTELAQAIERWAA